LQGNPISTTIELKLFPPKKEKEEEKQQEGRKIDRQTGNYTSTKARELRIS